MKIKILPLIFFLSCILPSAAQQLQPKDFDFTEFKVITKLDSVCFYIYSGKENYKITKPNLIFLQGSGGSPIFFRNPENGKNYSSIFFDYKTISADYNFIIISKPNIPFFSDNSDSLNTSLYDKKISLSYRVEQVNTVIEYLFKNKMLLSKTLVVCGHSEGAYVAAKVATLNKRITHVGCFSGGGMTQFYDFVVEARKKYYRGEISAAVAQLTIDSLLKQYKDILHHPDATDKSWYGHTYKRWATFTEPMVDNLMKLDIPVFVSAATEDENSMVESSDIIPIAFLQKGKTNLTYKYYLNCDHYYMELKDGQPLSHQEELENDFLQWLMKNKN